MDEVVVKDVAALPCDAEDVVGRVEVLELVPEGVAEAVVTAGVGSGVVGGGVGKACGACQGHTGLLTTIQAVCTFSEREPQPAVLSPSDSRVSAKRL